MNDGRIQTEVWKTGELDQVGDSIRSLGGGLAHLRRAKGFSRADLAALMGTSLSSVRRMEEGCPGTAISTIAKAISVLGNGTQVSALVPIVAAAADNGSKAGNEENH